MTYAQLMRTALPVPPSPLDDALALALRLRHEADRLAAVYDRLNAVRGLSAGAVADDLMDAALAVGRALSRTRSDLAHVEARVEALDAAGPEQPRLPFGRVAS